MNQKDALKERLSMFHFSYEKLTIVRGLFSLLYTMLWSALGLWMILKYLKPDFEMYNLPALLVCLSYYLFFLTSIFILIDITFRTAINYILKILLTFVILLFSGAVIPIIYLKDLSGGLIEGLPFSIVYNQLIELLLNNYIIDTHPMFYWNIVIIVVLLITSIYWRYRQ